MQMKKTLNIVIADDHPLFVDGLRAAFAPSMAGTGSVAVYAYIIIGVARSSGQVGQAIKSQKIDLLVLDLGLPDSDGLKTLLLAKKESPETRILILTTYDDPKLVKAAFKSGADGYMLKTGGKEELYRAISEVMNGNTFLGKGVEVTDKNLRGGGFGQGTFEDKFAKRHNLTKREMEVLRHIGQAMNNKDISVKLYISDQTVSVHRKNIMRKLGVNSTASLIKIAYENHLV